MSVSAGAVPLYGTCVICMPVAATRTASPMCRLLPTPEDAHVILFGLALAYATRSFTDFAGKPGWVSSSNGA